MMLSITLLVICYAVANSQLITKKENLIIAEKAIKDLKGGTLVFRMKSKNNKITKLQELIDSPDISASTRNTLIQELDYTIYERDYFNTALTYAFEKYYNFSNIYFMYDTASILLKDGQRSGIFLNKDLQADPTIEIPEGEFFVIKVGNTDSSSTTGIEALVVMDRNLTDLKSPFPYYVRINSIGRLFRRIFNHNNLVRKDSREIIMQLEKNFQRFSESL